MVKPAPTSVVVLKWSPGQLSCATPYGPVAIAKHLYTGKYLSISRSPADTVET